MKISKLLLHSHLLVYKKFRNFAAKLSIMRRHEGRKIGSKMRDLIKKLIISEGFGKITISDELMNDFINAGKLISLKGGEKVIAAGEINPDFYILIEGIMRQWYWNGEQEVTPAFGEPGTQILNFHSYIAGVPSNINIESCCKAKLFWVKRDVYDHFLNNSIEFCNWRLQMAYNQFFYSEERLSAIQEDAYQRYRILLESRPEIVKKVPLKIIATYLGITPQYLSYLRNKN